MTEERQQAFNLALDTIDRLQQERDTWKSNCDEAVRQLAAEETRVKTLEDALMKLSWAIDGLCLDYPYLSECKVIAKKSLAGRGPK